MELFIEVSQVFFATFMMAFIMPIFWIVLFICFMQYRRQAANEEKLFGYPINKLSGQMLYSIALGALGGFFAGAVFIFLGLSLEQIGLYFIWPVAILLLLINPRYLCFSYAGGIVGVLVLIARHLAVPLFPGLADNVVVESLLRVHIPAVLVLIGLLHLIEALLIYIGGHWGSSPVYLKENKGKVVGAYVLQRFWPIPLVAMLATMIPEAEIVGVSMPDWWPILEPAFKPGPGKSLQYMVIPIAAGLGYADIALSSTPQERSRFSACYLGMYSIVLLIVAIGAEFLSYLVLPGVIFAPLGHELLILYGKKVEYSRQPRHHQRSDGVQLMAVLPKTSAEEAGLAAEDIILKVNGEAVKNTGELAKKIDESYFMVHLEGMRYEKPFSVVLKKSAVEKKSRRTPFQLGERSYSSYSSLPRCVELGFIPVPEPDSPVYMEIAKPDPLAGFKRLAKKITRNKQA